MTSTATPGLPAAPAAGPRLRASAVALAVLAAVLGGLLTTVSYGLAREYGDPHADVTGTVLSSLQDWGLGLLLVAALSAAAFAAAGRSRGRRALRAVAVTVVVVTVVGVPALSVLGARQRLDTFPAQPSCADGFGSGPAAPVVRRAESAFAELEHPGPFTGGGWSGVDGCATQLVVDPSTDVTTAYRGALLRHGWDVDERDRSHVRATRDGQAFEAWREGDGAWWVWVGPATVRPQQPQLG